MNPTTMSFLYVAVIFVGAFLSFEIQPLVGKMVTAGFGGSAAIWGVCLLFFQSALLGGYTLTYILARLTARSQSIAYLVVVVSSAACLSLPGPGGWSAGTEGDLARTLLVMLATHLAFPCLILSSISGMMQTWFNQSRLGDPYPLYSLSNIGSLGALLAYPLLIEPALSLTRTISYWRVSYYVLVLLLCVAACDMYKWQRPPAEAAEDVCAQGDEAPGPKVEKAVTTAPAPSISHFAWWILLGAMGTLALVSYTAYLTQDIAPVPLVYVIPLCLYLCSFIITFAGDRYYKRALLTYLSPLLWIIEAGIAAFWVERTHQTLAMTCSLGAVLAFMFGFFLTCQGELYRSRPAAIHLASFYLAIAFGGMLGGVFVNFAAPALFDSYMERYIVGGFIALLWIGVATSKYNHHSIARAANCLYAVLLSCALFFFLAASNQQEGKLICQKRNFFGCLTVRAGDNFVALANGQIMHGKQFTADAAQRRKATLYYGEGTGVDLIDFYLRCKHTGALKYGVIGLGAGTIATYGKSGDSFVFYEIDPKVSYCAHKYFSFLSDSQARVAEVAGDGRALLKREQRQNFNLLIVDAFNGDAIPVHLLTKEAINLYFSHVRDDGIVLAHVTNRFIDLEPVLGNLASCLGLKGWTFTSEGAKYVALSRAGDFNPAVCGGARLPERFHALSIRPVNIAPSVGIWTDDYSNLFGTIQAKWQGRGVQPAPHR